MDLTDPQENAVPLKILLIEDSLPFAQLATAQLQTAMPLQHSVQHLDNVTAGLAALKERPADLIILDLHLPDSHGLDTFRTVHAAAPDTPIVILSSDDSDETALSAVQLGADDYLVKGADDRLKLIRSLRFALERKRRLAAEHELTAAQMIQRSLLPECSPTVPGFEIAGAMSPAVETAGDYFDFITPLPVSDGSVSAMIVADVSGHGHGPAMVMAETRGCLHAFARVEKDPARILKLTHEVLTTSRHSHFVTIFLALLDTEARTLTYASAGHESFLLRANGDVERLEGTGLPVGIGPQDFEWETVGPIPLHSDDLLILFTDGVPDFRTNDQQMFGLSRTLEFVQEHRQLPPVELIVALQNKLRVFANGTPQVDDVTIVVARTV